MSTPHPTADPVTAADHTADLDLRQSTILVVDDNTQNVELLQAYLEALPCKTITAGDGVEAMKIVETALAEAGSGSSAGTAIPDLILLDVMMPRMSGFEVCRKLKEDPATRSIPIMMVTALNELGDIERGVESGTDDFLTKPVNKLELITRVKSLLRVRHLKRELDRTMAYIQDIQGRPHVPGVAGASPGSVRPDSETERYQDLDDDADPGKGPIA
ncbi:MAG: response regulator [Phycisphaeraceae bacterium]|nr:response regulator [Phycisphaeraceae bacterium]